MAAGNYNRNVRYYNISKGKFVTKNRDGEKSEFDFVNGLLTAVKVTDEEYEGRAYKLIRLNLFDGEENSIVNITFGSGYGRAFCKCWENCDLTKQMELSASYKKEENKPAVTSLFVLQDGKPIKWFYKKDDYKDMPSGIELANGKWDFSDQEKFFLGKLELLSETLSEIVNDPQPREVFLNAPKPEVGSDMELPVDDLPF